MTGARKRGFEAKNARQKSQLTVLFLRTLTIKPDVGLSGSRYCNCRQISAQPDIRMQMQYDSARRRRLTRPQGALLYTAHDKGKRTENREVA
jgi:hypothetical protein